MARRTGDSRVRPPVELRTRAAMLGVATLLTFLVGVLGSLVMVLWFVVWRALPRQAPVTAEEPEELFTFVRLGSDAAR